MNIAFKEHLAAAIRQMPQENVQRIIETQLDDDASRCIFMVMALAGQLLSEEKDTCYEIVCALLAKKVLPCAVVEKLTMDFGTIIGLYLDTQHYDKAHQLGEFIYAIHSSTQLLVMLASAASYAGEHARALDYYVMWINEPPVKSIEELRLYRN